MLKKGCKCKRTAMRPCVWRSTKPRRTLPNHLPWVVCVCWPSKYYIQSVTKSVVQLGNTTFDADVDLCKICGTCIALCLGTHARLAFAVGAVECHLRKYRDECNRIMPQWERDIKDNTSTQLKLLGVRKLHIFKWLLPHCKNWKPFMSDHNFDLYFPKLADLEERTLKRQKIEPQTFVPTNVLPDSVIEVLCDVYKRVLFVTRVMPYMYEIECIQF